MSKLSDAVIDGIRFSVQTSEKDMPNVKVHRGEVSFFCEMRSQMPVSEEHESWIYRHLAKVITYHLEEIAYGDLLENLYELEREFSRRTPYTADSDAIFAKIYEQLK